MPQFALQFVSTAVVLLWVIPQSTLNMQTLYTCLDSAWHFRHLEHVEIIIILLSETILRMSDKINQCYHILCCMISISCHYRGSYCPTDTICGVRGYNCHGNFIASNCIKDTGRLPFLHWSSSFWNVFASRKWNHKSFHESPSSRHNH